MAAGAVKMQPMSKHQAVHRPSSASNLQTIRKPASRIRAGRHDSDHFHGIEDSLASEFSAHINELCLKAPLQHRRPSPLNPPTAAVAAQLDALQINDWPETDAGVHTAMAFAKPYECEQLPAAVPQHQTNSGPFTNRQQQQQQQQQQPPPASSSSTSDPSDVPDLSTSTSSLSSSSAAAAAEVRVRSWSASEQWLTPQQFVQQLHAPPYDVLLGCDSWRACSNMVFPATRVGKRAVQAVEVLAAPRQQHAHSNSSSSSDIDGASQALQKYTFTFCLELISRGPYEGCWMTVGVRPGDYSV